MTANVVRIHPYTLPGPGRGEEGNSNRMRDKEKVPKKVDEKEKEGNIKRNERVTKDMTQNERFKRRRRYNSQK